MGRLKHLPLDQWPPADHAAFQKAYAAGDIFDDARGPGAHLAKGTRRMIQTAYRRWLGFLNETYPADLQMPPSDRITPERVHALVEHLSSEVRPTAVALVAENVLYAARLFAPDRDWKWLRTLTRRLHAKERPVDRFVHLVPGWQTLNLGLGLMDKALLRPHAHRIREIQYRDGLLLAVLSCWPIRRRSIAALTISRHLEFVDGGINILLHAGDTKSKRADSFRVPDLLVPYLQCYLEELRPRLMRHRHHDGLWASYRGGPLAEGRIYDIVRREVMEKFGKAMSLHDFRRASATFLATVAPEKVGLIAGILQHASPNVSEKHYNRARSIEASRRFGTHLKQTRDKLRKLVPYEGD